MINLAVNSINFSKAFSENGTPKITFKASGSDMTQVKLIPAYNLKTYAFIPALVGNTLETIYKSNDPSMPEILCEEFSSGEGIAKLMDYFVSSLEKKPLNEVRLLVEQEKLNIIKAHPDKKQILVDMVTMDKNGLTQALIINELRKIKSGAREETFDILDSKTSEGISVLDKLLKDVGYENKSADRAKKLEFLQNSLSHGKNDKERQETLNKFVSSVYKIVSGTNMNLLA